MTELSILNTDFQVILFHKFDYIYERTYIQYVQWKTSMRFGLILTQTNFYF